VPDFRRPSLLWPIVIVGLGALLLLQSLGYLPAGLWAALAQLWPILLIVFGLHWLIGRRSRAGAALVIVVGVLLVVGSLTWAALTALQLPAGAVQTLAQPAEGAAVLDATLNFNAGALRLAALAPSDHLMEATARNGPGETARQDFQVAPGGAGRLVLRQWSNPVLSPFLMLRGDSALWDIRLAPRLPLTLTVNAGDAAVALDLTGLQLTALDLSSGLGAAVVTFPAGQPAQARVRAGLAPVTLNLPAGLPVRVTVRPSLARVSLPASLAPSGAYFTTAAFDPSQPFLSLDISAGLGGVTVQ